MPLTVDLSLDRFESLTGMLIWLISEDGWISYLERSLLSKSFEQSAEQSLEQSAEQSLERSLKRCLE